jgi:hypothetical protein
VLQRLRLIRLRLSRTRASLLRSLVVVMPPGMWLVWGCWRVVEVEIGHQCKLQCTCVYTGKRETILAGNGCITPIKFVEVIFDMQQRLQPVGLMQTSCKV